MCSIGASRNVRGTAQCRCLGNTVLGILEGARMIGVEQCIYFQTGCMLLTRSRQAVHTLKNTSLLTAGLGANVGVESSSPGGMR